MQTMGELFKQMRIERGDTLDTVAEAVELGAGELLEIEEDALLPSGEMVEVLASYYNLDADLTSAMLEIVSNGELRTSLYQKEDGMSESKDKQNDKDSSADKPKQLRINLDASTRVLYSDMVQIHENEVGVVLNFIQTDPGNQGYVVSRIGMSKQQAAKLSELLKRNLS